MKCGPPEQAVIPSIAHSGRKVKGRPAMAAVGRPVRAMESKDRQGMGPCPLHAGVLSRPAAGRSSMPVSCGDLSTALRGQEKGARAWGADDREGMGDRKGGQNGRQKKRHARGAQLNSRNINR